MTKTTFRALTSILAIIGLTLTFQNCGQMESARNRLSDEARKGLIKPAFKTSPFEENVSPQYNEGGDTVSVVPGAVQLVTPTGTSQVVTSETTCQIHTPGLDAFRDSIKTKAPAADQDVQTGELNGCQAGLVRFSAAAVDNNGQIVAAKTINGYNSARVGLYCPFKADTIGLLARYFVGRGIRGGKIARTYLCTAATDPQTCNPTSVGFIGGLEYGKYGRTYRISNLDGVNDAKTGVDSDDIVSKLILPNNVTYTGMDVCNKVALWSPLVIESKMGQHIRTLDPRTTNTLFDLSGNGVKNRISCVQNGAFLALPDDQGRILNINQLFGNNTVGPDGQLSVNGFVALGKHDRKIYDEDYGIISPLDPVWNRLRLWEDRNCDGTAQPEEISGLDKWNITAIRWADYINILDIDPYGNQTRQRDFVHVGRYENLRIFDLWFREYQ